MSEIFLFLNGNLVEFFNYVNVDEDYDYNRGFCWKVGFEFEDFVVFFCGVWCVWR